jgi:hypothetical protein
MKSEISPSLVNSNIVLACHITGVYDVNRNTTLQDNNYELVRNWAESLAAANLQGIIFHNNFTAETCEKYENEHISFVEIDYDSRFSPNVYRYFIYRNFLQQEKHRLKNVFVTDVSDVTLVRNPFVDLFFLENLTSIFCGDEPTILRNDWMLAHSEVLRNTIADFTNYEVKFGSETLLNCGIIGGEVSILYDFIQKLSSIHQQFNSDNKTAYTGDMGAFNYLARTEFNQNLKHGAPVNTVFKMYETERMDCWFKHK